MLSNKQVIRLASKLQTRYEIFQGKRISIPWRLYLSDLQDLLQLRQQAMEAVAAERQLLVKRLWNKLKMGYHSLSRDVERDYQAVVEAQKTLEMSSLFGAGVVSLKELVADIRQLEREFGEVTVNWKQEYFEVLTPTITFDDFELGEFRIRHSWGGSLPAGQQLPFVLECIAVSPVRTQAGHTHPHVSDDVLCLGDAKVPYNKAITQGRIADAVLLVNSTLQHYVPESAYATMDAWNGETCPNCDNSCEPGELATCSTYNCRNRWCDSCRYACSSCEAEVCSECVRWCSGTRCGRCECVSCAEERHGDGDLCLSCLPEEETEDCEACDDSYPVCDSRLHHCTACQKRVCNNCFAACDYCGDRICQDCAVICAECGRWDCAECDKNRDLDDLCDACRGPREDRDGIRTEGASETSETTVQTETELTGGTPSVTSEIISGPPPAGVDPSAEADTTVQAIFIDQVLAGQHTVPVS